MIKDDKMIDVVEPKQNGEGVQNLQFQDDKLTSKNPIANKEEQLNLGDSVAVDKIKAAQ